MSEFSKGDRVRARVENPQVRLGAVYVVEDVETRSLPFGDFVTYWLREESVAMPAATLTAVVNAHLLLERAPAAALEPTMARGVSS